MDNEDVVAELLLVGTLTALLILCGWMLLQ